MDNEPGLEVPAPKGVWDANQDFSKLVDDVLSNLNAKARSSAVPRESGNASRLLESRNSALGNCTALYNRSNPLHITRGKDAQLYDEEGTRYLDCVNNVSHVGHSNERVTTVVSTVISTLNTNIRYLNPMVENYATRLTQLMGYPLRTEDGAKLYMTTSGSEANDLALRIAFCFANEYEGGSHVAVMEGAYHGHTLATLALSPYKFDGPGGQGKPTWVHVLPLPDVRRGLNLDGAQAARHAIAEAAACGGQIAAFFCESIISCGGQVILPEGYLKAAYQVFRCHGALCIADEVQCGFGRVGPEFWAYHTSDVIPDMVTLAKSMGNGIPMGGVVVKGHIAAVFDNTGMEYFSTCGGCTVSIAVGLAVLDELYAGNGRLIASAAMVGQALMTALVDMQQAHDCIADVRGLGLMIGIEFRDDARSQLPASAVAKWVQSQMRDRNILLSLDGPSNNVIKIKPPMVFSLSDVAQLSAELDLVLRKVPQYLLEIPCLQARIREAAQEPVGLDALKQHLADAEQLAANAANTLDGADDPTCTALLVDLSAAIAAKEREAAAASASMAYSIMETFSLQTEGPFEGRSTAGVCSYAPVSHQQPVVLTDGASVDSPADAAASSAAAHANAVDSTMDSSSPKTEEPADAIHSHAEVFAQHPKAVTDEALAGKPAGAAASPDGQLFGKHTKKPAPERSPVFLRLKHRLRNLLQSWG